MSADDETIYAALAALMPNITWTQGGKQRTWVSGVKRRIKLFSDVPQDQQPWIGQAEHASGEEQVTGMPYKTTLEAQWVIYHADAQDPDFEPTITNNLIIKACRDILAPRPSDPGFPKRNTLNGLVHHCYMQGRTIRDPGDIDGQGLIIVPIKLLVP
jgi:hypothetical protein